MVIQRFCRAYMESPPPAVFHYKYQSYKYERNTAGKSASHDPPKNDAIIYEQPLLCILLPATIVIHSVIMSFNQPCYFLIWKFDQHFDLRALDVISIIN